MLCPLLVLVLLCGAAHESSCFFWQALLLTTGVVMICSQIVQAREERGEREQGMGLRRYRPEPREHAHSLAS